MRVSRRGLLSLVALAAGALYAVVAYRQDLPPFRLGSEFTRPHDAPSEAVPRRRGRWQAASDSQAVALTPEQREAMERLRSVGYLSGSTPSPGRVGVTLWEPDSAAGGLNLAVSGHAPQAWLFDMEGRVLHRWACSYAEAFPGVAIPGDTETPFYWRRAHLYPNGDLLAVFEGLGLIRLDRESRILWALSRGVHHDVDVLEDGTILALLREPRVLPRIHPKEPVLEDFVAVIDPEGRLLRKISLLEAFERSSFRGLLTGMPEAGDLFHTNTLEALDGTLVAASPLLGRGNVLVSLLTVNVIAIVDLTREETVWAATGIWKAQHQPTLLPDGRILLLDNQGRGGRSRVMEVEPKTGKIGWMYGDTEKTSFATYDCGSVSRLGKGNTLITESSRGRAFEITRSGRLVWEYYNPARAGEKHELIATLFEVVRLRPQDLDSAFVAGFDEGGR